jgi:hypothetical protein
MISKKLFLQKLIFKSKFYRKVFEFIQIIKFLEVLFKIKKKLLSTFVINIYFFKKFYQIYNINDILNFFIIIIF